MTTPAVRVGIVSWNTASLLDRCLACLPAALAGVDAEVVVVDNASADDSVAVASRHPGVRVEQLPENVGYARGMNQALAGTRALALLALNPDTEAPPGSLATLVRILDQRPSVGLVAPRLRNPDGTLQHSVHRFPSIGLAAVSNLIPRPLQRGSLARRWWLDGLAPHDRRQAVEWAIGAVHCIRAAALDREAPYRERWFMYVEDLDLCWRLHSRGWQVLFEPAVTVTHTGNAAGAQAWGARRSARWMEATYDWYRSERGAGAARAYAALNLAGCLARRPLARQQNGWLRELLDATIPVHARAVIGLPGGSR